MRFPLRAVMPVRTRPVTAAVMTVALGTLALVRSPGIWGPEAVVLPLAEGLLLLVLAEPVEDQLGHARHAMLLAGAAALVLGLDGLVAVARAPLTGLLAAVAGAHLALLPQSRIVVWLWIRAVEVPTYFVVTCWALSLLLWPRAGAGALGSALTAAVLARVLRRPERLSWDHLEQAR